MAKKIFKCRLCGSGDYQTIFETAIPLSGQYSISGEDKNKYPLHVVFCKNCGHVQLANDTPVNLYDNYLYTASYSTKFKNYIADFVKRIDGEYQNCAAKKIIEIGSSNGALLKKFQDKNWEVLGIEPSKILADEANRNGVSTLNDYFGANSLETIRERIGTPNVVVLRHVLEHLDNLPNLVAALAQCISQESRSNANFGGGAVYIEVPYVKKTVEENQFYAFYHEHVSYFSVKSLKYLLEGANLKIVDVAENPMGGGSILVKAVHDDKNFPAEVPKVSLYLREEEKFISPESLTKFSAALQNFIKSLSDKIKSARKDGAIIAGWGAGQRACTLINLSGLTEKDLAYVVDVNQNYRWKYINGTGIQIVPPEYLKTHRADKIFIFATGYADEIISENSEFVKSGGEFVKII